MKGREVVRMVGADGWRPAKTRSSHRNYLHPIRSGRVTIPGHLHDTLAPKTLKSILRQARLEDQPRRYPVMIEDAGGNYSTYVPDLTGCVSTGATLEEVKQNIRDAIELHLEGMADDGEAPPASAPTRRR